MFLSGFAPLNVRMAQTPCSTLIGRPAQAPKLLMPLVAFGNPFHTVSNGPDINSTPYGMSLKYQTTVNGLCRDIFFVIMHGYKIVKFCATSR